MIIGTRGSRLAVAQTDIFLERLRSLFPLVNAEVRMISTTGDRVRDRPLHAMGGFGVFVKELDERILAGDIDCAVNSLKDMPMDLTPGTRLACVLPRGPAEDVLVADVPLQELREGAVLGTSSVRRKAMLLHQRPDLNIRELRGNLTTRLKKMRSEGMDGIVVARAGLERLAVRCERHTLDPEVFVPAVGQGAIAVVCREGLPEGRQLSALDDGRTRLEVESERFLQRALGGGCSVPVGIHAVTEGKRMTVRAAVLLPDGSRRFDMAEGFTIADRHAALNDMVGTLLEGAEGML
ncbi:MAG: hydroxymethylbilane synthase [Methanomassiliicoccales archaeon]|nr:hydroxymethylbilane synthase [Methanomassiliicoccales archaeon]